MEMLRTLQAALQELSEQEQISVENTRKFIRYAMQGPVLLGITLPNETSFKPLYRGWATDLSLSGVGILTEQSLPLDTPLSVNLSPCLNKVCVLPVKVVYCRQLLPHTYRSGATFQVQLPDDFEEPLV